MKDGKSEELIVPISVEVQRVNPSSLWDDRDETFTRAARSEHLFDGMRDIDREFVTDVVRSSLEYAAGNVEQWLPHSFNFDVDPDDDSRSRLVISLEIQHSDIRDNAKAKKFLNSSRIVSILGDMAKKSRELDG